MARPEIPRVPLWQIFALITALGLVGSVATLLGAGRPPSSAFEVVLTFVPPVILAAITVWLWRRSAARARDARSE
ncbi:hypothetical protein [Galactobacter caseinivorans]|uniref:Uncharacterized protein n=1 Tax=Galactobacter caseinivorans TaxID=2676123 RepID=A0A496PIX1_9MICC|nr:hypothetical protein [Galactobacter caseinivorans]RKW70446.1 hypothetical protein DWQ67_08170 [Galactobacter caseinivorans]